MVKKGQNSVKVSIEWPQKGKLCIHVSSQSIVNGNIRKMFSSRIKSYLVIISLKSRELVAKHATIIQMRATKTPAYYISPIEIGVL